MNVVIPIQGNAQALHSETGLERLFYAHIRQHASPTVTTYHPRTWKTNVTRLLEQLQRARTRHLFLIGYSHGQSACMEIARRAPSYDIATINMALCDPVWRSPFLPRHTWAQFLAIRSVITCPKIIVPDTVSRVVWCRQKEDWPRGHNLVAQDKTQTYIAPATIIPERHTRIQWAGAWFRMVDEEITRWLAPLKATPV